MDFLRRIYKNIYFFLYALKNPRGLKCIGEKTIFRKPLRLQGKKYICVGKCCDIMNGIRMECIVNWNHTHSKGIPRLEIADYVVIGQNCHITCGNTVLIGEGTNILPDVLITDIKHISEADKSIMDTGILLGSVTIGRFVQIGKGACIMANGRDISIGDNAIIGANAVVTRSVDSFTTVVGVPARPLKR